MHVDQAGSTTWVHPNICPQSAVFESEGCPGSLTLSDFEPITCFSQASEIITSILTNVSVPFQPSPSLGCQLSRDEGVTLSLAVSSIPRKF